MAEQMTDVRVSGYRAVETARAETWLETLPRVNTDSGIPGGGEA